MGIIQREFDNSLSGFLIGPVSVDVIFIDWRLMA